MTPRQYAIRAVPWLALFVAGVVVAGLSHGATGKTIGLAVMGLGGVGLVSYAFYEVGRSEDRDRADRDPRG